MQIPRIFGDGNIFGSLNGDSTIKWEYEMKMLIKSLF